MSIKHVNLSKQVSLTLKLDGGAVNTAHGKLAILTFTQI